MVIVNAIGEDDVALGARYDAIVEVVLMAHLVKQWTTERLTHHFFTLSDTEAPLSLVFNLFRCVFMMKGLVDYARTNAFNEFL